jgi:hypothetical protein
MKSLDNVILRSDALVRASPHADKEGWPLKRAAMLEERMDLFYKSLNNHVRARRADHQEAIRAERGIDWVKVRQEQRRRMEASLRQAQAAIGLTKRAKISSRTVKKENKH